MESPVALIPAAGAGLRMRPHTHSKPKPLITVAGKPIIGHILDGLKEVSEEVVVIVGHRREVLIPYLERNYGGEFRFHFVPQDEMRGLGHAVFLGLRECRQRPILITLGDEFFSKPYSEMVQAHNRSGARVSLGIKEVDRPQVYGIVVMDKGKVVRLIEKPADPPASTAIAGVYLFEDGIGLYEALKEMIEATGTRDGEVQLTDALQRMLDAGYEFNTFDIEEWYDCGRPEMLLEVNRKLLAIEGVVLRSEPFNSVVVGPVNVGPACTVENSVIGPNVSIARGCTIRNTIVSNTIVGSDCEIERIVLKDSIVGDEVRLRGRAHRINAGENTDMELG